MATEENVTGQVKSPTGVVEPDEELVERARVDGAAFGELYERHVSRIYSYLYYRTGSACDAEELTEKVFFQAFTHFPKYVNRGLPFSAWLFTIAHNLMANWHRDRKRNRTVPLDSAPPLSQPGPDLEREEELAWVRRAVAALPAERQHLIYLKYVEGLSNADIGRAMRRSEGAIKALLHRTIKSLRDSTVGQEAKKS